MSESNERAIWFFLDEFPQFPKAAGDSVDKIINVGRSKGSRMFIFSQTRTQLAMIHGEHRAKSWNSTVGTVLVGKNDLEGAEEFSRIFGERLVERQEWSTSGAGGIGSSMTVSTRQVPKAVVDSSTIASLGKAKGRQAVDFLLPLGGRYLLRIRLPFVERINYRPGSIKADWTQHPGPFKKLIAEAIETEKTGKLPDGTAGGAPAGEGAKAEKATEQAKTIVENATTTENVVINITTPNATTKAVEQTVSSEADDAAEAVGIEIAEHVAPGIGEVIHAVEMLSEVAGESATATTMNVQLSPRERRAQRLREQEQEQADQFEGEF